MLGLAHLAHHKCAELAEHLQAQHGGTIPENLAPKAFLGASSIAGDGVDSQYVEKGFVPSGWTGTTLTDLILSAFI